MSINAKNIVKKIWRYKLLIYPRFQLSLIAVNLLVTTTILSFVSIQINRVITKLILIGESANIPKSHIYFQFINWQLTEIHSFLAIAFIVGIAFSSMVTLYISYKLVGPVVRMKGYFKSIEDTSSVQSEISFRKNDFFSDLPAAINGALKRLKKVESQKQSPVA
jgi:hypothetical protein